MWQGGYTTQVDVFFDVPYALANPDTTSGNLACLTTTPTDPACTGTWFSFSSAINDSAGNFRHDFAFVAATVPSETIPGAFPCAGWTVVASFNTMRTGVNVHDPANNPFCVTTSGWYTYKHTFFDNAGVLNVTLELIPVGSTTPIMTRTLVSRDLIADLGCNRYGWFVDEEIQDLAIDNSIMAGCGTPLPTTTTTTPTTPTSPADPAAAGVTGAVTVTPRFTG